MSIRQQTREDWRVPLSGHRGVGVQRQHFFYGWAAAIEWSPADFQRALQRLRPCRFYGVFGSVSRSTGLFPAAIFMSSLPIPNDALKLNG